MHVLAKTPQKASAHSRARDYYDVTHAKPLGQTTHHCQARGLAVPASTKATNRRVATRPGARTSPWWPPRGHQPRCSPCPGSAVGWACSRDTDSLYLHDFGLCKLKPRHAGLLCSQQTQRGKLLGSSTEHHQTESIGAQSRAPGNSVKLGSCGTWVPVGQGWGQRAAINAGRGVTSKPVLCPATRKSCLLPPLHTTGFKGWYRALTQA